jgi:hypothetical protein
MDLIPLPSGTLQDSKTPAGSHMACEQQVQAKAQQESTLSANPGACLHTL